MGVGARKMFGWAVGGRLVPGSGERSGRGRLGASDFPVMWIGLIELELRHGFGSREIEGRGLVEVEFALGRAASGGHAGRAMRPVEMEEDALYVGGQGDERNDLHLGAAGGTQERKHLVDASQELGPEDAAGSRAGRSCPGTARC